MKALVVYYSKTGNTRAVAEEIATETGADIEEIVEVGEKRAGLFGFLRSGRAGFFGEKSHIRTPKKDPGAYDLVFVGTPVWAGNVTPAIRSYFAAVSIQSTPMALFCTMGSSSAKKTFASINKLAPAATVFGELAIREAELKDPKRFPGMVTDWIDTFRTKIGSDDQAR